MKKYVYSALTFIVLVTFTVAFANSLENNDLGLIVSLVLGMMSGCVAGWVYIHHD